MKKLLLFTLLLLTFASTCSAFNIPSSPRWKYVIQNQKIAIYLDTMTIKSRVGVNTYGPHKECLTCTAWVMVYLPAKERVYVCQNEYDLECQTKKPLHVNVYDDNHSFLLSLKKHELPSTHRPVVPESYEEHEFIEVGLEATSKLLEDMEEQDKPAPRKAPAKPSVPKKVLEYDRDRI